jgi:uncharacterized protein YxjI
MTDNAIPHSSDTRRTFLKKSALTSGALMLGLSSAGTAAAQNGGGEGLMYTNEFNGEALFRVISPVLEQNPEVDTDDDIFDEEYNSRKIMYLNTDEQVYLFPTQDAEIQEGNVYQLSDSFSLFEDSGELMEVEFDSATEVDPIFDGDYELLDGGGQALVQVENFDAGALLRVTSQVVSWTPPQEAQGSDLFADYNTRHAQYLNTNDQFNIYPAEDAQIEQGAIYQISDEFEITDAEGNLMTLTLERVDEEGLNI